MFFLFYSFQNTSISLLYCHQVQFKIQIILFYQILINPPILCPKNIFFIIIFCPLFVHYFLQNRPKQTIFHNQPFLKNVDFLRFIKSHKHTYQPCNRICESEILSRKKPLQILCKGCKIVLEKGYRFSRGGQSDFAWKTV